MPAQKIKSAKPRTSQNKRASIAALSRAQKEIFDNAESHDDEHCEDAFIDAPIQKPLTAKEKYAGVAHCDEQWEEAFLDKPIQKPLTEKEKYTEVCHGEDGWEDAFLDAPIQRPLTGKEFDDREVYPLGHPLRAIR